MPFSEYYGQKTESEVNFMPPKYPNFKNDLAAVRQKIAAIREEFFNSVKAGSVEKELKENYDALNYTFERIESYFNVIEDSKSEPEEVNKAFKNLSHDCEFPGDDLPTPSEYNPQATKDFNQKMDTDNFRRIYRASSKLKDVFYEIKAMSGMEKFAAVENKIDEYGAQQDRYREALYSFDEQLPYDSYADLYAKKKKYHEEMLRTQNLYDEYAKLDEVKTFEAEYKKVYAETMRTILQYTQELSEINKQLEQNEKSLDEINEQIRDLQEREGLHKEELDRNVARLNDIYASINKNSTTSLELSQQITEIEVQAEKVNDTYKNYSRELNELENAVVKKGASTEVRVTTELKSELAHDINTRNNIRLFENRFNSYLAQHGYDKMPPEKVGAMLEDGRKYTKLPPKVLEGYRNINFAGVLKPLEFYNDFVKFRDEFKEIYGASEKMSKEMDEKVTAPSDLFRLSGKAADSLNSEITEMLAIKDGDPRLNGVRADKVLPVLNDIAAKGDEMISVGNSRMAFEMRQQSLIDQKNKLEAGIVKLQNEAKELEQKTAANTFDAKLKELFSKRDKIVDAKEKLMNKHEYLTAEMETERAKRADAHYRYESAESKLQWLKEDAESAKKLSETTDRHAEKIEAFAKEYDKLSDMQEKFRESVRLNSHNHLGGNYWADTKAEASSRIKTYLDTAECAKKKGHENSDEFNDMVAAVRRYKETDDDLGANCSLADYKRMLENIRDAAQNYLDKKATETRPFASTQRKYRLDYAKRLCDFADGAAKKYDEMDKTLKDTDKMIDAVGVAKGNMKASRSELLETVNAAVEKKQELMKKQNAHTKVLDNNRVKDRDSLSIS